MNSLFFSLGIESWKPLLTAFLLPPIPWLLMVLVGARTLLWRRGPGWSIVILAVSGLWLSQSVAVGEWLQRILLAPPPALSDRSIAELKRDVASRRSVAIVVLGGGRQLKAPEYGMSNLEELALERLRFGLWLARETGAPVAYSGGIGHGQQEGVSEAEIASRIAAREFGRPLQWLEGRSRDTRENARHSLSLLRTAGITKIVLVTHGWHMARALRAFEDAALQSAPPVRIVPAPMGLAPRVDHAGLRWMPTAEGGTQVRQVLREFLGRLAGA